MKTRFGKPWNPIVAALFAVGLLAPSAVAQVNMQLTGAGPDNMGGVYVGPYTALVNGVSTQVICDDFVDDTYILEKWQATQTNLLNVTSDARFGAKTLLYERGAWLVLQMSKPANAGESSIGAIQYALWELFAPSANPLQRLSGTDLEAAQSWLGKAQEEGTGVAFTADELAQFSNFVVYTPIADTASCGGVRCPSAPPQEFLALKTPESAALLVLLLDLLALSGVVLVVRRHVAEVAG